MCCMKNVFLFICLLFCLTIHAESMFEITLRQAKSGDAMAQNNVAAYYKEAGNCEQAVYWYRKAVAQGDRVAMYGLGQCYATGCGVSTDYAMAAQYFEMSAKKGQREAMLVLAEMYERGIGVSQNSILATYWRSQAKQ